jgi:hypothetical protein
MKNTEYGHPQAEGMNMLKGFQDEFITTRSHYLQFMQIVNISQWKLPTRLTKRSEHANAHCQICSSSIEG